ncbi:MAG: prepilin-type N-terminal cleavage/methylation domain-containing protein [Fretibacterium sp.]|nr:prepilin-type N-terminal cleavage/methylation domain-containing protein [Fretibacterium sp.]
MKMRKGFTLVELLIVIVIIGILAAAMLLSSGSATASADAAAAVSEMRALKAAIILYISNAGGELTAAEQANDKLIDLVSADMENPQKIVDKYSSTLGNITVGGLTRQGVTISVKSSKITAEALEKLKKNKATTDNGTMEFPVQVTTK